MESGAEKKGPFLLNFILHTKVTPLSREHKKQFLFNDMPPEVNPPHPFPFTE